MHCTYYIRHEFVVYNGYQLLAYASFRLLRIIPSLMSSNFNISFICFSIIYYTTEEWELRAFYNGLRRHSECMSF